MMTMMMKKRRRRKRITRAATLKRMKQLRMTSILNRSVLRARM
jgi:hypothetical protein